jgi:polynucleotide 5'-kinase involved in rRNA processing
MGKKRGSIMANHSLVVAEGASR